MKKSILVIIAVLVLFSITSCERPKSDDLEFDVPADSNLVQVDSTVPLELNSMLVVSEIPSDEIFLVTDELPTLIGGLAGLSSKINYPTIARKAGIEGKVFVSFVVDENGNAVDASISRGIGAGCDSEALRVVRQAKFTPGRNNGIAVKVRMTLPIKFSL